jgi:glycolate oxidase
LEVGAEIMRLCVDAGGSITGEHGVGQEKRSFMEWIFSPADIDAMAKVKAAFGSTDLYNPCKLFPTGKGCGEVSQANIERVMAQAGPDAYV